jgi:hypothetical protein
MEIYCDCPRFAQLSGMILLPVPGNMFMYGDCQFTSSSSSSSSSGGTPSDPPSSSDPVASRSGTLAYNVGGYWELQNSEIGLIGILVTGADHTPEGEYQFVAEGCDGTQLTVRPVTPP